MCTKSKQFPLSLNWLPRLEYLLIFHTISGIYLEEWNSNLGQCAGRKTLYALNVHSLEIQIEEKQNYTDEKWIKAHATYKKHYKEWNVWK